MMIKTAHLGKVIIEVEREHGIFMVLTPDGNTHVYRSREKAEAHARKYFSNETPNLEVTRSEIEWRIK